MYRITLVAQDPSIRAAILRLEGRLTAGAAEELARALPNDGEDLRDLQLDLAGVTYIDGLCLDVLCDFLARGARVLRSSIFVKELLKECES